MNHQFWWPGVFWPKSVGKQETRENFVKAFGTKGYRVCDGPDPEEGYEKIALYELDGVPTHAAKLLPDGRWSSKLGSSNDIAHTLEALNGDQYGEPVLFLKRALQA
ncbi:MAG: hypothetical protein ABIQ32_09565 [Sphingomicrobium sp.]